MQSLVTERTASAHNRLDMLADVLTKQLPAPAFWRLANELLGRGAQRWLLPPLAPLASGARSGAAPPAA